MQLMNIQHDRSLIQPFFEYDKDMGVPIVLKTISNSETGLLRKLSE